MLSAYICHQCVKRWQSNVHLTLPKHNFTCWYRPKVLLEFQKRPDIWSFNVCFCLFQMTGLDIDKDQIIEMACLITDSDLNVLAEVMQIFYTFVRWRSVTCVLILCVVIKRVLTWSLTSQTSCWMGCRSGVKNITERLAVTLSTPILIFRIWGSFLMFCVH